MLFLWKLASILSNCDSWPCVTTISSPIPLSAGGERSFTTHLAGVGGGGGAHRDAHKHREKEGRAQWTRLRMVVK